MLYSITEDMGVPFTVQWRGLIINTHKGASEIFGTIPHDKVFFYKKKGTAKQNMSNQMYIMGRVNIFGTRNRRCSRSLFRLICTAAYKNVQ